MCGNVWGVVDCVLVAERGCFLEQGDLILEENIA